jgi:hypothetical protein
VGDGTFQLSLPTDSGVNQAAASVDLVVRDLSALTASPCPGPKCPKLFCWSSLCKPAHPRHILLAFVQRLKSDPAQVRLCGPFDTCALATVRYMRAPRLLDAHFTSAGSNVQLRLDQASGLLPSLCPERGQLASTVSLARAGTKGPLSHRRRDPFPAQTIHFQWARDAGSKRAGGVRLHDSCSCSWGVARRRPGLYPRRQHSRHHNRYGALATIVRVAVDNPLKSSRTHSTQGPERASFLAILCASSWKTSARPTTFRSPRCRRMFLWNARCLRKRRRSC